MKILGIETSCDETAAAIVKDGKTVLSSVVASSKSLHEKTGGIIPEVAAREQVRCIVPVLEETLKNLNHESRITNHEYKTKNQELRTENEELNLNKLKDNSQYFVTSSTFTNIDAIAVTVGPGLNGSLLVGVETAKTIAMVTGKPIIPVNHVLAHIYANYVSGQGSGIRDQNITYPAIALVVSGGHTELYLMESSAKLKWLGGTLDDAAGEAFDKTARMLGLGYGGGAAIAASAAKSGIRDQGSGIRLPRPMIGDQSLNFSFSGLKTAVMREIKKLENQPFNHSTIQQFAFEIQEAITDVLVEKTMRAAKQYSAKSILLGGGVAANERLKEKMELRIKNHELGVSLHVPLVSMCTDNAVMIAACAYYQNKPTAWQEIQAQPDLSVEVGVSP